jgi:hypothetical protein
MFKFESWFTRTYMYVPGHTRLYQFKLCAFYISRPGVLLYHIIFIPLYYTHYDTITCHFDTIISLNFLQMSRLLFFIISLTPKRLLFHLWHFCYITYFIRIDNCYYCHYHTIICIIFISNYYYYYLFRRLLSHLFVSAHIFLVLLLSHYY